MYRIYYKRLREYSQKEAINFLFSQFFRKIFYTKEKLFLIQTFIKNIIFIIITNKKNYYLYIYYLYIYWGIYIIYLFMKKVTWDQKPRIAENITVADMPVNKSSAGNTKTKSGLHWRLRKCIFATLSTIKFRSHHGQIFSINRNMQSRWHRESPKYTFIWVVDVEEFHSFLTSCQLLKTTTSMMRIAAKRARHSYFSRIIREYVIILRMKISAHPCEILRVMNSRRITA